MLIWAINNSVCLYFRNKYAEYNTEKLILYVSQLAETVSLLWAVLTAQNTICIWQSCQQALSEFMQSWQGRRNHFGCSSWFKMFILNLYLSALDSLSGFFPCVCPCYTTDLLPVLCLIFMPNFSIIFTNDIYRNNFYSDICIKELPSSFYCRHTQRCLSGFDTHTLFVA